MHAVMQKADSAINQRRVNPAKDLGKIEAET